MRAGLHVDGCFSLKAVCDNRNLLFCPNPPPPPRSHSSHTPTGSIWETSQKVQPVPGGTVLADETRGRQQYEPCTSAGTFPGPDVSCEVGGFCGLSVGDAASHRKSRVSPRWHQRRPRTFPGATALKNISQNGNQKLACWREATVCGFECRRFLLDNHRRTVFINHAWKKTPACQFVDGPPDGGGGGGAGVRGGWSPKFSQQAPLRRSWFTGPYPHYYSLHRPGSRNQELRRGTRFNVKPTWVIFVLQCLALKSSSFWRGDSKLDIDNINLF